MAQSIARLARVLPTILAIHLLVSNAFAFPADFDGDGKRDIAIYRPNDGGSGHSTWYVYTSSGTCPQMTPTGYGGCQFSWGLPGDIPITGDYDGDGKAELTVVRPSSMLWYIRSSIDGSNVAIQWGIPGIGDKPDEGDFNHDGVSDLVVYRGTEDKFYVGYYNSSSHSVTPWSVSFSAYATGYGTFLTVPISAKYLNPQPNDALSYYFQFYSGGQRVSWPYWNQFSNAFGGLAFIVDDYSSIPVVGNYVGAGTPFDFVNWHPYEGGWHVYSNTTTFPHTYTQWGLNGDTPVSGDFDGDGIYDYAVWRPSNGVWYIKPSTGNCANVPGTTPDAYGGCEKQWGVSGDIVIN